jgi:choline dehydrogenase-like flavoprotein
VNDVVIIGSGFGGAVMAARLSTELRRSLPAATVVLLEQGNDPTGTFDPNSLGGPLNAQGNRFRNSLAPHYLSDLAQLFTDTHGDYQSGAPSMTVATGRALGGGSQVYDGVSLRAPTEAFEQTRDGVRLWPAYYSRSALDPFYARVEARLKVRQLQWTDSTGPSWALATRRDYVFAEGCRRIGATAVPLKVADDNDANEGWWNEGQRFEGRQSLTKNYLLDAQANGCDIRTGCGVDTVAPVSGGYVVRGTDRRSNTPLELECRLCIVAGGAVGSSGLLLRSRAAFGALDDAPLGAHLSANGDYGVTGTIADALAFDIEGFKGKPMSSFCPTFYKQHQFILIPFYAAPLYLSLSTFTTLLRAKNPMAVGRGSTVPADAERDWGLDYKQRLKTFGARMLTMGCLALDTCEGVVRLGERGTEVSWGETDDATEARWSAAVETMGRIYSALGGEMFLDGYRKDGTVHTSHPLGGCRMAENAGDGVVDACGEVFGQPNLFVVDGAVIPSALCANPSLTIAAVAESIADRLIAGTGTVRLVDRLS